MLSLLGFLVWCVWIFMTALFAISIVIRRNDVADVVWGIGVAGVGVISYLLLDPQGPAALLVTALATLWGVRLATRIFLRNRKKAEDRRYGVWRETWGRWFYPRSYLQVYLLQGFLMIVVGYPVVHAAYYGGGTAVGLMTLIGLSVWCIGFFFEVVGDWQLDRFLAGPRTPGQVLDRGLWRFTRHPNYFGEVTMWWGIWLMVSPLPLSWVALVGPLTITVLILKVSGIPMLERAMKDNPAYQAYAARTSVFVPWPPRR
jgi:steroid 5-alpha reductase family enzyme